VLIVVVEENDDLYSTHRAYLSQNRLEKDPTTNIGFPHIVPPLLEYPWSRYLGFLACWRVVGFLSISWRLYSRINADPLPARELTLDAAQSARSARSTRSSTKTLPAAQVKKLLDSRNDREILDGLRKVVSVCLLSLYEATFRGLLVSLHACCAERMQNYRTNIREKDDVPFATMPHFLLLRCQECRLPEHRDQETSLHLPPQPCRARARPRSPFHKYHTKVSLRWQPPGACSGTKDHVWNPGPGHQPNCVSGNQEGIRRYEPVR
jgi:hypothetical protein